ncbi:hypothetical protein [Kitasatospora phosalacinea]|uniref:Minor tail protein n=1 Tax=Kitasatospora phosalacinea TaxID=2065 RepID=A0ABW6GRL7_9ACTN
MATRLYLTGAAPTYTPPTRRGTWNVASGEDLQLLARKPAGAVGTSTINVGATTPNRTVLLHRSISAPAVKAGTLSGTLSWVIGAKESAAGLNGFWRIHVYVTSGDTDTPRGTLLSNSTGTTALPTTAAGATEGAQTITPVAIQAGDRIVAEIGYSASASATTQNATINYGQIGTTDLANGATTVTTDPSWIELSGGDGLFTAAFATLTDGFTSTIDSKWVKTAGVAATGGRAVIPCTSTLNSLYTATAYEIQGSQLAFQVAAAPTGGTGAVFSAYVGAGPTLTNTNLEFEYSVATGNLVLRNNVSGTDASPTTLTYDPVAHQWWRIRESGGSITMDTSPDGATWTTRRTISTPSQWMRTGTLIAQFEAQNTSGTSTSAQIDNINTVAGPITVAAGTAVDTSSAKPAAGTRTAATGQAADSNTARPASGQRIATVGRGAETSTAKPGVGTRTATAGHGTDISTAQATTGQRSRAANPAAETSTARPGTGLQAGTAGRAVEASTARSVKGARAGQAGAAADTSTARSASGLKAAAVGTAVETDQAVGAAAPAGPSLGTTRAGTPRARRWAASIPKARWTAR